MLAGTPIAYWVAFFALVVVLIAFDLVMLNRPSREGRIRGNLLYLLFLVLIAAALGVWMTVTRGRHIGMEFASGYLIELSLSIDNLFVFLVIFGSFGLDVPQQKRALALGVTGAMLMRGLFMFFGIELLERFAWIEYVFGVILLVAAFRLFRGENASSGRGSWPERCERQIGKVTGWWSDHPQGILLSAVLAIELADLVFAMDSIPAVLAVTRDPFVVYSSNILAILGLRSLYFVLANLLNRLRFLHFGLAAILFFVGLKMILTPWITVPIGISLAIILLAMAIAVGASLRYPAHQAQRLEEPR